METTPNIVSNTTQHAETLLFFTLLQLVIIIAAARSAGELARKIGQPRVIGEIVAGLLLGPSLFGYLVPELSSYIFHSVPGTSMIIISQIGLILLMFQIGMEFDFSHLREKTNRQAVAAVSAVGIALPFILGFIFGQYSSSSLASGIDPLLYSLFTAIAMSITAVPVLGRIMMEYGLTRTKVGVITISAAAVNDVVGWLLLTTISTLSLAKSALSHALQQTAWLLIYIAMGWWLVKPAFMKFIRIQGVSSNELRPNLLGIVLVMVFISSMLTFKIGIFAIFGGFMLGVLVHEHKELVASWKKYVGTFVNVFFLPVFFTYTGLRTNVMGLNTLVLWEWCAAVIVLATLGKFVGVYLTARTVGLCKDQANTAGILMNTRGLMELVVLNVGYDMGVIPQNVFTMFVIMAVFSTIITAPVLRSTLPKFGHAVPRGIDA